MESKSILITLLDGKKILFLSYHHEMSVYEVSDSKIRNILNLFTRSVSSQLLAAAPPLEEDYTFLLGVPQNDIGRCGKEVRFCNIWGI